MVDKIICFFNENNKGADQHVHQQSFYGLYFLSRKYTVKHLSLVAANFGFFYAFFMPVPFGRFRFLV